MSTICLTRWSALALSFLLILGCHDERELPIEPGEDGADNPAASVATGETILINGVEITDLGAFDGGWSVAYGVNEAGEVVGTSNSIGFHWDPSTRSMTLLPNPWNDWNIAFDINRVGQVTGAQAYVAWWWDGGSGTHAVNGPAHDIGFATGSATGIVCKAGAYGINDNGDVVGGEDNCGYSEGFIWTKATNTYARVPGSSAVVKVNNRGKAIGGLHDGRAFVAGLNGQNIVVIPSLGGTTRAHGINDAGQVVGSSVTSSGNVHAYLWNPGDVVARDLGTLGGITSEAVGINAQGQVVGWSTDANGARRAFLWDPRNGAMRDLGTPSGASGASASDINDHGHVVGYADYGTPPNLDMQANFRATRWVVLPDPGATPAGTNVAVEPAPGVTLTYGSVTAAGTTTVTTSSNGTPPPEGFRLGNPRVYYDIQTTATFSGPITVCINYGGSAFRSSNNLRLFHSHSGGPWVDVTTSQDATNTTICGTVESLSPFLVAEEKLAQAIAFTSIPPSPSLLGGSYALSATGGGSGNPLTFSSLTPGTCTVTGMTVRLVAVGTCSLAADQPGNDEYTAGQQARQSFSVIYAFTGFFQPVDNVPLINRAKAGSAIPVKFRLGGDQGLGIFDAKYPKAVANDCASGAEDLIEQTVPANSSGLTYDAAAGQYTYVWKTQSTSAASGCLKLTLKLKDGTTHEAIFHLVK